MVKHDISVMKRRATRFAIVVGFDRCLFSVVLEYASQVGVLTKIFLVNAGVDGRCVVFLSHGTYAKQEVIEVCRGNDDAEDADGATHALHAEVVIQTHGGENRVIVVLQAVVFFEGLHDFIVMNSRVGRREDIADVVQRLVNTINQQTVIVLNALVNM